MLEKFLPIHFSITCVVRLHFSLSSTGFLALGGSVQIQVNEEVVMWDTHLSVSSLVDGSLGRSG